MARSSTPIRAWAPVAALAAVLLVSCGEDEPDGSGDAGQAAAGFAVEGDWRGQLEQKGLGAFTVRADIRSLEEDPAATVSYSKIECSGDWRFLGRDGGSFRFRETIDRGRGGTCKGSGTVILTPAGADSLRYRFQGGGVESRGDLTRAGS